MNDFSFRWSTFFWPTWYLVYGMAAGVKAGEAENYYLANVDTVIQQNCIVCHKQGGQADTGGASILFTSSASNNHKQFESFVNSPTLGARADTVLSKVTGGSSHGGGVVLTSSSQEYDLLERYVDLLVEEGQGPAFADPFVYLEQPFQEGGSIYSGVGNIQGYAVSPYGIERVEIYFNGTYVFDAPYGGSRNDVASDPRFTDIEGADFSGFSLTFNYNLFGDGLNVISAIAVDKQGARGDEVFAEFQVVTFGFEFISNPALVDLSMASCNIVSNGISVVDALVGTDDAPRDFRMEWRTASQSFQVIEIR